MSAQGTEIIGIVLQIMILFSLVIITDRLLKIQRLAEHRRDQGESGDKALDSLADAVRKLTGRFDTLESNLKGNGKKTPTPKPRAHPDIRKTRKICPECEAFIPVDDPRCSNCGFFFDGKS